MKNKKGWIIGILVVLFILVVCFLLWYFGAKYLQSIDYGCIRERASKCVE